VGVYSGIYSQTGTGNTYIGHSSGLGVSGETGGSSNTAVGYKALAGITTGTSNVVIGSEAGVALTSSSDNIIIGYGAMDTATTNANKNIAIGNYALDACTATAVVGDNVAVGYNAGTGVTTGDQNTFIGNYAGDEPTEGQNNTCIGYGSDTGAVDSSNQTAIGYACVAVDTDNSVTLGSAAVTDVYMAQDSGATVHCAGVYMGANQPAAAAGTMGDETLDHYEEGTWSPIVSDGTRAMSMDDAMDTGYYTRIGNLCTVTGRFTTDSLDGGSGNATGDIRITGLPFTVKHHQAAYSGGGVSNVYGIDITAGHYISLMTGINDTVLYPMVWDSADTPTHMTAAQWTADGQMRICVTYRVA
jgi:hypothetical protein